MSEGCLSPEDLGMVEGLPASDPRRAHLQFCPRCSAALLDYHEFMSPTEIPPHAGSGTVAPRLASALEEAILGRRGFGFAVPADVPPRTRRRIPGFRNILSRPRLRPLWAAAAAAVLIIAFQQLRPSGRDPGATLRGVEAQAQDPVPVWADPLESGGSRLQWKPASGTERAVLVFYGADLAETGRFDAGPRESLFLGGDGRLSEDGEIGGDDALARVAPGSRYWRVLCFRGSAEIARSRLRELPG